MPKVQKSVQSNQESVDFETLFKNVLLWAKEKGDSYLLERFCDALELQLRQWLASPPTDKAYANSVIGKVITEVESVPDSEDLKIFKSRLYVMRGLIWQYGFDRKEPRSDYALQSFCEATFRGNGRAWENIGDIYYIKAMRANSDLDQGIFANLKQNARLVSEHADFNKAMQAYELAESAQQKLFQNCLKVLFWESITIGDFESAQTVATKIASLKEEYVKSQEGMVEGGGVECLTKSNLSKKDLSEIDEILVKASSLNAFKDAVQDAQIMSTLMLTIDHAETTEQIQTILSDVAAKLSRSYGSNPVSHYILGCAYEQCARKSKLEGKNPEEVAFYINQAKSMFKNVEQGDYPSRMASLHLYAKALRKLQVGVVTPADSQSVEKALLESARSGCFLAYCHLGNLAFDRDKADTAARYYMLGAKAGDPHAAFCFLNRYFAPKYRTFNASDNVHDFVELFDTTLAILKATLANPFTQEGTHKFLRKNISEIEQYMARHTEESELLNAKHWAPVFSERFTQLHSDVVEYQSIEKIDYEKRLLVLHRMQLNIELELDQVVRAQNGERKFILDLQKAVANAESYLTRQFYLSQMKKLANRTPSERWADLKRYYGKGHGPVLTASVYNEFIDPWHRRCALLSEWHREKTPKSYLSWLHSIEGTRPAQIQQVIYLDAEQRVRYKVAFKEGQAYYAWKNKMVPDGKYLYVMDEATEQLYLADEIRESCDEKHFHHTSFLSGNPAMVGGLIEVKEGRIVFINNSSGHYTPNIFRLNKAVAILKERQALPADVKIGVDVYIFRLLRKLKLSRYDKDAYDFNEFEQLVGLAKLIRSAQAKHRQVSAVATEEHDTSASAEPSSHTPEQIKSDIYRYIQFVETQKWQQRQTREADVSAQRGGLFSRHRRSGALPVNHAQQLQRDTTSCRLNPHN